MGRKIVVRLWGSGFCAHLEGNPAIFETGPEANVAVGRLVKKYPEHVGLEVVDQSATSSE